MMNKKISPTALGLIGLGFFEFGAQTLSYAESIQYSQSSTEAGNSASIAQKGRISVGFSTIQSTIPGSSAALTSIYDLTRADALQGFFSIPNTSPFNIGFALFYKRTVAQSRGAGFHIGGGLGLASINGESIQGPAFAMTLSALAGFHFELPGISHVNVHLDGGPTFVLINTSPNTTTNFQVGALSPALGASIVYIF